ncbi:MAG TPA: PA2169 family four-helix-bundle protein [Rhodanobacter sp.]
MSSSNDQDVKILNGLIETTIDSADGYAEAAQDAESTRFSATFQSRATERRHVANVLQQQVRTLGGKPDDEGSVLASAHRVFVNLRKSISAGDTAVVDEVERGEDHIKAKFESALKDQDVSSGIRALITDAYASVKAGHDQMRDLKHAMHNQP